MVQMTHPKYGTRTVKDEQVERYERVGWSQGGEVVPELIDGNVDDVLDRIGDDPQLARQALAAEQERSKPRKSLVTALAPIAVPTENQEI